MQLFGLQLLVGAKGQDKHPTPPIRTSHLHPFGTSMQNGSTSRRGVSSTATAFATSKHGAEKTKVVHMHNPDTTNGTAIYAYGRYAYGSPLVCLGNIPALAVGVVDMDTPFHS